jgi:hypothetical protein
MGLLVMIRENLKYYVFKRRGFKTVYGEDVVHLNYQPFDKFGKVSEFPLHGNIFITGNRPLEKVWLFNGSCGNTSNQKDNGFLKAHLKTFDLCKDSLNKIILELLDNKFDIPPEHFKFFGLDLNNILKK